MKKYFKFWALPLISMLFIISCDEDETAFNAIDFSNTAYVSFKDKSLSSLESSGSQVQVIAYLSTAMQKHSSEITVNFEIKAENATASDYAIKDGKSSFVFKPNVFSDTLYVTPVDNFTEDGNKKLTLDITSVSGASDVIIGAPGPDSLGKSFVFTIEDDDCAYTFKELADASWSGEDNAPASQAGPNQSQIDIQTDASETKLFATGIGYGWITDTAYWNEVIINEAPTELKIDNKGTITIDEQFLCRATWNGAVQPDYSIRGKGQFTSCSKTMVIEYDLLQNGSVLRSFTETISY